MMRLGFVFLITVFGSFCMLTAQSDLGMQVDVVYLSSDLLEGREAGTPGEDMAADYIVSRFQEMGLQPAGQNGTFIQPFAFNFNPNPHGDAAKGEQREGKNVLAYLDNGAERTVIIGAHYDHLGKGAFGSRYFGPAMIHNGADDNASGVAAMLWLAEQLKQSDLKNHNYLFIGFSGEELGLYGSKHFVKNPTIDLADVNYMLNMDMVGHLNEEKILTINGVGTSPAWKPALDKIQVEGIEDIVTTESGVGPSDHTSFYLKDIPSLHFFTGAHDQYHKPGDDAPLINFEGMQSVATYMLELVEQLDGAGELAFSKTKDEQKDSPGFKVTMGVMPDYSYTGKGMRIDAVLEDRPAQKAGLQDGDVVIKIGEHPVGDIYGYMEALSKYEKGQKVKVVVMRGEEAISRALTF